MSSQITRVRFPYLSVFIGLYTLPFFVGIYLLATANSLTEVTEAIWAILLYSPAVASTIALWRGDAWVLKPLVLFFVTGFIASIYINIQDKTLYSTLIFLAILYWLIAGLIIRHVYKKQNTL